MVDSESMSGSDMASPAPKPHLIRRHETQALVEPAAVVRGVKHDAPDAAPGQPVEDGPHQRVGDAAPPPDRFHVDVENNRFGSEFELLANPSWGAEGSA